MSSMVRRPRSERTTRSGGLEAVPLAEVHRLPQLVELLPDPGLQGPEPPLLIGVVQEPPSRRTSPPSEATAASYGSRYSSRPVRR